MQTHFANTICFYFSIFYLLRSLKLALHHDKNKPLSHTTQNTDRTMHLSDKTKYYLFTAMPMYDAVSLSVSKLLILANFINAL